jgi:hypothetical protein
VLIRRLLALLALLVTLESALAQTVAFAGLAYGASPRIVDSTLAERGYEFEGEFGTGGQTLRLYRGEMLDHPILVSPLFDQHDRLEMVAVFFYIDGTDIQARDATLIRLHDGLKSALTDRYGAPSMSTDLAHVDGKVDDSPIREGGYLARHLWFTMSSIFRGSPEGLEMQVRGARESGLPGGLAPHGYTGPDDLLIALAYVGDPSNGSSGADTNLDDL